MGIESIAAICAARATDTWYASGEMVLKQGENVEKQQESQEIYSAWSYEDLPSNALGVEFEEYLENTEGEFLDVLEQFLTEKGYVNNPLEVAPNANSLPLYEDKNRPPSETNKTYEPRHTIPKPIELNQPIQLKVNIEPIQDNTQLN